MEEMFEEWNSLVELERERVWRENAAKEHEEGDALSPTFSSFSPLVYGKPSPLQRTAQLQE